METGERGRIETALIVQSVTDTAQGTPTEKIGESGEIGIANTVWSVTDRSTPPGTRQGAEADTGAGRWGH